jgi:transposase
MAELYELPPNFSCPYRRCCPHLGGMSADWAHLRCQSVSGSEDHYEYQLRQLHEELDRERKKCQELERHNLHLQAQFHALHRRQFKSRTVPEPSRRPASKKRGAPPGHPPWRRPSPKQIDQHIAVAAPDCCPHCQSKDLRSVSPIHRHLQEDIVLAPRTVVVAYTHEQAYCPVCRRNVWQAGPGELPGCCIGPAAKATEIYLRQQLHVPYRKISRFFADFFGLKFVPASAFGFERQAVRRARPLYEDLRQKIRSLPVVHADETSWRHEGNNYWNWYAGNDDLAFFHLDAHRSAQAAQSVLGQNFAGIIVADAFASYKAVHPKAWQSCLAHIKTKARELEAELNLLPGQARDPAALRFCRQIQRFVHDACQAHHRLTKGRWLARRARKQERSLRRRLSRLCARALHHPKAEAFRSRLRGPEQANFFTCFRQPDVPPTNNQAERSLRPLVIMRKVIQGTRSAKGLENHSVLRSLFETSRRQGKLPHRFLLDLFTKNTAQAQSALYRNPLKKNPAPALRC